MTTPMGRRPSHSLAIVLVLMILGSGTALGQRDIEATSPDPPPSLPAVETDMVSIPFSVAPVEASDRRLTILADKRGCGLRWREKPRATAVVVETTDTVVLRMDVRAGKDGEPCPADRLERLKVRLSADIGERTIIDATRGEPALVNLVDPIDTGLGYNCNFGDGDGIPIATLLGPGLDVSRLGIESTIKDARAIEDRGDDVTFLGPLGAKRQPAVEDWRLQGSTWGRTGWGSCQPMAARTPGIDAATWRLRGRRPNKDSRSIKIWVGEIRCAAGQPPVGRITRPIIQVRKDAIVIIMGTQPVSAFPARSQGSRSSDSFTFVDCQGAPPAPYTVKLPVRLGKRKLYDGGVYPPKEYPGRSR